MPRKRRADQGPPIQRCKNACQRCREKRFKCSDDVRPCLRCLQDDVECRPSSARVRGKKRRVVNDRDSGTNQNTPAVNEPVDQVLYDSGTESQLTSESIRDQLDVTAIQSDLYDNDEMTSLPSSILPWTPTVPRTSSLLSSNSQYRMLWHHYVDTLACLHSSHDKTSNPIIRVLGPVAQSSESLLAVLLASSLENLRSLRGEKPDQELLTSLLNTAVHGIQREIAQSPSGMVSDQCLAAVIALCDFEIVARKRATTSSWRVHLEGAKKIIDLRGGPRSKSSDTDLWKFLMKWLAYFDIMSSITPTSSTSEPLFQGVYWRSQNESDEESEFRLDPYMSFLQDVMPMFFEISALMQEKRELNMKLPLDLELASNLLHKCRLLEAKLYKTLGQVSGQAFIHPRKLNIMINCHDAFVQASLIHLYRRVEGLPSQAPVVRKAVAEGLCNIASSCQLNGEDFIDASLLFPLFTLGCEIFTDRERRYILDRLLGLQALGLGNVDRAIEVLQEIWSQPIEADKSLDWDDILGMFNWEVNLA